MNTLLLIEALGSVLYLSEKVFLSFGKRFGWLLGFLGAIAFTIVTIKKGAFAYSVLEISGGVVCLFGIFAWRKKENVQKNITITMSIVAMIGIFTVMILNMGSPNFILENTMAVLFALGTIYVVLRHPIGWLFYLFGQLVLTVFAYTIGTYFILGLQVASIPFSVIGYRNFKKGSNIVQET